MQEFAQSIKICFLLRFSSRCQDLVPFFKKLLQRLEAYITRIMARKNIHKDTILMLYSSSGCIDSKHFDIDLYCIFGYIDYE